MRTEKNESTVQKGLESLCRSRGWSYGAFWRFDPRNSSLLTLEDVYYEEHMGVIVDNMLLQAHFLGNGIVGQAAFTKKHRWMFSDAHCKRKNPAGYVESQNIFQDESEIQHQFSSGIETVALISVEPRGVVQFGSTQKIPESMEFVDQTKRMFEEIENGDWDILPEDRPSSSATDIYGISGLFASSITSGNLYSANLKPLHGASSKDCVGTTCSLADLPWLTPSTSEHGRINPYNFGHQFQTAASRTSFKLSSKSNTWLEEPLVQSTTYSNRLPAPTPCISTWSSGHSTQTSSEGQLPYQIRLLGSQTASPAKPKSPIPCRSAVQNFHDSPSCSVHGTGGLVDPVDRSTSPITFEELFQAGDYETALPKFCPPDTYSPWNVPSSHQHNGTLATSSTETLSQAIEDLTVPSGLDLINIPVDNLAESMQNSIVNTFASNGNKKIFNDESVGNDLFDSLGVDFECGQVEDFLNDILMPVLSGGQLDFSTNTSECISEERVGSMVSPRKRLFSKLGLEQFSDGIASCSNSIGCSIFEDELSSANKRRKGSFSVSGDPEQLTSLPCVSGSLNSLGTVHNWGMSCNRDSKKEIMKQSEVGSWINESYSFNSVVSQRQRSEECTKVARKRARPGSGKKPKDRVQIQERIAELRKLIPNGVKMSIDSLLAQTIKYMLFLQSVTKHAEKLKHAELCKTSMIEQETETVLRDKSSSSGVNTMWACEVGPQTMADPVDVKDLGSPGQKIIQMLCEEKGFFLEIVDIIQGFGLTILKGLMEVQENQIWACFIVEAEANRHVTKKEIYVSLHQLLYKKATTEINETDQLAKVLNRGTMLFNNYDQHQHLMPLPISLAETLR